MADFAHLVTLCRELEQTPARLEKLRLVAGFLRTLPAEDVATAPPFLTGVSDGLVLEAIAQVAGTPVGSVRRAALRLGDLSAVAVLAATGGAAALAAAPARPGVPLQPMLAESADDVDEALAAHRGRSALEFKYDGARIQLHRDADRVAVWTRRLSDVTRSLPDVVAIARRDLAHAPFILHGEVLALDPAGRPLPFQELMRRFRRVHGVDALVREMPLARYFCDCLRADG